MISPSQRHGILNVVGKRLRLEDYRCDIYIEYSPILCCLKIKISSEVLVYVYVCMYYIHMYYICKCNCIGLSLERLSEVLKRAFSETRIKICLTGRLIEAKLAGRWGHSLTPTRGSGQRRLQEASKDSPMDRDVKRWGERTLMDCTFP